MGPLGCGSKPRRLSSVAVPPRYVKVSTMLLDILQSTEACSENLLKLVNMPDNVVAKSEATVHKRL